MVIELAGRKIGAGQPCFIIAEAGVNHDGRLSDAARLVDAAARAGADAVKFQTFSAERLVTAQAPKAAYQKRRSPRGESQLDMLRKLELDEAAHRKLKSRCGRSILFMSTPFDEESADLLERLGVPAYKLPSGELTNHALLRHVARKGKPMILSTGMSNLREIAAALKTVKASGNPQLVLLHCVSLYPTPAAKANLRAMKTLSDEFGLPVGFSDHTLGTEVALAAAALGACLLEKHFTLDRRRPGPDHAASLEPRELAAMVRGVRSVESALGHGRKEPCAEERGVARVARKSLVAARRIGPGERLTREVVLAKRPGTGLPPSMLEAVVGRTARRAIPANSLITLEMLA